MTLLFEFKGDITNKKLQLQDETGGSCTEFYSLDKQYRSKIMELSGDEIITITKHLREAGIFRSESHN